MISKSNCAFVNYRDEESCISALARFHDSRFEGAKLVCRLRKASAAPPAGTPTGPRSSSIASAPSQEAEASDESQDQKPASEDVEKPQTSPRKVKEKFFVLKSLTIDDLAASVLSGSWATQSHNEAALNTAYKVSVLVSIARHRLTSNSQPTMSTSCSQPTNQGNTMVTRECCLV